MPLICHFLISPPPLLPNILRDTVLGSISIRYFHPHSDINLFKPLPLHYCTRHYLMSPIFVTLPPTFFTSQPPSPPPPCSLAVQVMSFYPKCYPSIYKFWGKSFLSNDFFEGDRLKYNCFCFYYNPHTPARLGRGKCQNLKI